MKIKLMAFFLIVFLLSIILFYYTYTEFIKYVILIAIFGFCFYLSYTENRSAIQIFGFSIGSLIIAQMPYLLAYHQWPSLLLATIVLATLFIFPGIYIKKFRTKKLDKVIETGATVCVIVLFGMLTYIFFAYQFYDIAYSFQMPLQAYRDYAYMKALYSGVSPDLIYDAVYKCKDYYVVDKSFSGAFQSFAVYNENSEVCSDFMPVEQCCHTPPVSCPTLGNCTKILGNGNYSYPINTQLHDLIIR